MWKTAFLFFAAAVITVSCKKEAVTTAPKNLYPLSLGNTWMYIDSFFDASGRYAGKDTFTIKAANTINVNNRIYTPITDQFDDSIFILASKDSSPYIQHAGKRDTTRHC
jgi:hypothetical protein